MAIGSTNQRNIVQDPAQKKYKDILPKELLRLIGFKSYTDFENAIKTYLIKIGVKKEDITDKYLVNIAKDVASAAKIVNKLDSDTRNEFFKCCPDPTKPEQRIQKLERLK